MNLKGCFSHNSDEWATPQNLFDELNKEFGFELDPCATEENAKCPKFYTLKEDGLTKNWGGQTVFVNPPYSQIAKWAKKCYEEWQAGATVVMLIPSRTDTRYFHDYIYGKAELRFIKGRLKFGDAKQGAPFPSMIVVFRKEDIK